MDEPRERDWLKFRVHFVCGAILGAFIGLKWWAHSDYASSTSWVPGVLFIGGGAILFGLIAGVASDRGDHFWHSWGNPF
ncbi:MAG: hypothetical protein ACO1QR_00850 [Chthoniobacteraceae bacterium]